MPLNSLGEYYEEKHKGDIWYFDTPRIGIRRCHRETGPARIYKLGFTKYEMWYLKGHYYRTPKEMPLSLFIAYCKWELNK